MKRITIEWIGALAITCLTTTACGKDETCGRLPEEDAKCRETAETPAFHVCETEDQKPPSSACMPLGASGDYCCPEGEVDGAPTAGSGLDPNVSPVPSSGYAPPFDTMWQWQLEGTINTGYSVNMYDVDLFDADASTISALKADGRAVICYFSAGSSEDWRSDFGSIPEAALGKSLDGWDGERWLDITHEGVLQVMLSRLDLAVQKACDGVEPDNVDGYANDTGFALKGVHQLGYNRRLANEAHARGLAVLLKNDLGQVEDLLDYFDGALNEECFAYGECDRLTPFVSASKPVFQVEYADNRGAAEAAADTVCAAASALGVHTLILPWNLDDSFRVSCDDALP